MLIARHVRGEELLGAVGAPFHRAAELARGVAHERVLRREAGLHAEAAADVAVQQAEARRRLAEHRAEQLARRGRRLALRVERRAPGLVHPDRAARLERHRIQPLVVQFDASDVRGFGEGFLGSLLVPISSFRGDIAACLLPQKRCARLDCLARIHDTRQLLILDAGELGGILCLRARLGNDRRHRLADIEHLAFGERRARRRGHGRAVGALEKRRKRDVLYPVGAQVLH